MKTPAIELRDVRHRHDDHLVLKGINLTIDHGKVFGFLGHNGAGKTTTTVDILTMFLRPTAGVPASGGPRSRRSPRIRSRTPPPPR